MAHVRPSDKPRSSTLRRGFSAVNGEPGAHDAPVGPRAGGASGRALRHLTLEVSNICQLRCVGCYMADSGRLREPPQGFSAASALEAIARIESAGHRIPAVDVLGGEPLLWRDLMPFVRACREQSRDVWIYTNLLAMDERRARNLLQQGVRITGKMNIADPTDPTQLRLQADLIGGTVPQARRMLRNVELMLEIGWRAPRFTLENLVRRQNAALAPAFYEWCLDHGVQAHVELPNCGADTRDSFLAFRPTRRQVRSLVASLQDIELRRGLGARPLFPPHLTGGPAPSPNGCCPFYGKSLYLRPNGDAQVCSGLREPLGNVHNDGVEFVVRRLWQATRPRAQSEMKGHCRSCELWNHCRGGCPTSALGAGDAMLPDPMCSRGEPW